MDTENISGLQVIFIKEATNLIKETDMARWYGMMGQYTKVNGWREFSRALVGCNLRMEMLKKGILKMASLK
mgnify:CR=1 FL=1